MEFHSFGFFGFLALALCLFYAVPNRARTTLLLVASYWFYSAWDPRFCLLILASTVVDYVLGIAISAARDRRRTLLLALSLVANLGILGVFKYYDFFARSLAVLLGVDPENYLLHLTLPVGISFFTFQTMSYSIDVYRGILAPRRGFLDFALFVAFFPQLVAGPIVKARVFFPQHETWRAPSPAAWAQGITMILLGLVKKTACADQIARFVDPYFANPTAGFLDAWTAVLSFAAQIFFDFSGYSDIAIGVALLFGYRFPVNFARPYLSLSITQFWRRWHISLSTWLRDYLYISMGGNRGGELRTLRNLSVTMLLGGLWHGASWNFLVWGGLHGGYLMVHKAWMQFVRPALGLPPVANSGLSLSNAILRLLAWSVTMAAVCLAWVFFRSQDIAQSWRIVGTMLDPTLLGQSAWDAAILWVVGLWFAVALLEERVGLIRRIHTGSALYRALAWTVMILILLVFARTDARVEFIYFQF